MPDETGNITQLLNEWREGSSQAENLLFERVYADLHHIAQARLKGERNGGPLQPTELVDQIYMRLVAAKDRDWQNRKHFFAIASRAMRHFLIDLARARPDVDFIGLEKLEHALPSGGTRSDRAAALSTSLERLEKVQRTWHAARKWLYQQI